MDNTEERSSTSFHCNLTELEMLHAAIPDLRAAGVSSSQWAVLCVLAQRAGKVTRESFPSFESIAHDTFLHVRTIGRVMDSLVTLGIVEIVRNQPKYKTYVYRIRLPWSGDLSQGAVSYKRRHAPASTSDTVSIHLGHGVTCDTVSDMTFCPVTSDTVSIHLGHGVNSLRTSCQFTSDTVPYKVLKNSESEEIRVKSETQEPESGSEERPSSTISPKQEQQQPQRHKQRPGNGISQALVDRALSTAVAHAPSVHTRSTQTSQTQPAIGPRSTPSASPEAQQLAAQYRTHLVGDSRSSLPSAWKPDTWAPTFDRLLAGHQAADLKAAIDFAFDSVFWNPEDDSKLMRRTGDPVDYFAEKLNTILTQVRNNSNRSAATRSTTATKPTPFKSNNPKADAIMNSPEYRRMHMTAAERQAEFDAETDWVPEPKS